MFMTTKVVAKPDQDLTRADRNFMYGDGRAGVILIRILLVLRKRSWLEFILFLLQEN